MNDRHDDLPADLAEHASERLLALPLPAREEALTALIAAHPQHEQALRQLGADLGGAEQLLDTTYPDRSSSDATHLGGHRVLRRLGEGAFGIVFLCAQERPVAREVAVKVLRPGAGDRKTLRRFAAERQLLASLNHPAITQVFDAGELPDGRPFVVMEYVDGAPLCAYCDQRGLGYRDRLRLFVEVCRGVAHAHSRGVVHRDLKPANVLVLDSPDGPRPKIIDFGIAKALTAPAAGGEPRTDAGRVIGTPGYMSPEQAAGRVDEVDERADVWALGVMLYELLTGELPWPTRDTTCTGEPPRPSKRVSTASTTAKSHIAPAARRRLAAELRFDLDWITLKALALERNDRYPSATALLRDIERHLRGEPVSVGPPSAGYRLQKLVRRHRGAFAWASACALVLVAGGVIVWLLLGRIERGDEKRLRAIVQAVALLEQRSSRAWADGAPDGVVRSMLADALALHDQELASVPERDDFGALRLGVLTKLATTCFWLGQYREAIRCGDEATQLAEGLIARQVPAERLLEDRATAARELGRSHFMLDEPALARAASRAAIELFTQLYARDPSRYAIRLSGTYVEFGKACGDSDPEQQLAAQQRAVEIGRTFTAAHPDDEDGQRNLVRMHCGLVTLMLGRGQLAEAESDLTSAEGLLESMPRVTDEERALVSNRRARLHAARQEPKLAVAAGERALQCLESLLLRNPDRQQPRTTRVDVHALLFEQYTLLRDTAAAAAHADAILTAPVREGTDDGMAVAERLRMMAAGNTRTQFRGDLAQAEPWLARSVELYGRSDVAHAREKGIEAAILGGRVAFDLGHPWPGARLEQLATAAATTQPEWASEAWLQAARSHLAVHDLAAANRCLAELAAGSGLASPDRLPRTRMLVALAASEPRAALAFASESVATNASSTSLLSAGIGAWRAAAQAVQAGDRATAGEARDLAFEWCERVAPEPTECGQLASAEASTCLALLSMAPPHELAHAAAALDALRGRVLATHWSEPLWFAVHLAAASAGARSDLRSLVQEPRPAIDDIAIAGLLVADPRLRDLALVALHQALEHGARGRQTLATHHELAPLRDDPAFLALLAGAPQGH